jgi:hypothetical protein
MTLKEKKKEKGTLKRMISSPYFEVRPKIGGFSIIVVGVIGVSEISKLLVTVKCHGMKLVISGSSLLVNVLEHNTLEIMGKVEDIKIING